MIELAQCRAGVFLHVIFYFQLQLENEEDLIGVKTGIIFFIPPYVFL